MRPNGAIIGVDQEWVTKGLSYPTMSAWRLRYRGAGPLDRKLCDPAFRSGVPFSEDQTQVQSTVAMLRQVTNNVNRHEQEL